MRLFTFHRVLSPPTASRGASTSTRAASSVSSRTRRLTLWPKSNTSWPSRRSVCIRVFLCCCCHALGGRSNRCLSFVEGCLIHLYDDMSCCHVVLIFYEPAPEKGSGKNGQNRQTHRHTDPLGRMPRTIHFNTRGVAAPSICLYPVQTRWALAQRTLRE